MLSVLSTPRLRLRPVTVDDEELLFELDSDPEVMRWLSGGPGTPLEAIREAVLPGFLALPGERGFGCWLVFEDETGDFLGWVSLRPGPSLEDGGEIGYRLRRAAWGRGCATEAAREVLAFAFENGGLARVFGTTYEANVGSRKVMEELGMTLVRRFRPTPTELAAQSTYAPAGDDPWDGEDVEYAINRRDWQPVTHSQSAAPT